MARRMPTAKAGNYAAPVDTAGMDDSMKRTLGVAKPKENRLVAAVKKTFGMDKPKAPKTAPAKSAAVNRTSDVPKLSDAAAKMEDQFSAERKAKRVNRTSDTPVVQKGQGIQGGAHKNTGTAGGY